MLREQILSYSCNRINALYYKQLKPFLRLLWLLLCVPRCTAVPGT